jgi:DNA polymerase alpha subunit B
LIDVDASIRDAYGIMDEVENEEIPAQMDGIVKDEVGREEGTADDDRRDGRGNVVVGGGYAKWTPVGLPRQNRVLCVGRICKEAHGGRLNQASVQLEGSHGHSMGSTIALDLSGLLGNDGGDVGDRGNRDGYSLFPGQIVAVEGINPSGRTMRVTRVIEGVVPPPLAPIEEDASPTSSSLSSPVENYHDDRCALSIWTACGPYTLSYDIDYAPLLDLVGQVVAERPDVVILCGPF